MVFRFVETLDATLHLCLVSILRSLRWIILWILVVHLPMAFKLLCLRKGPNSDSYKQANLTTNSTPKPLHWGPCESRAGLSQVPGHSVNPLRVCLVQGHQPKLLSLPLRPQKSLIAKCISTGLAIWFIMVLMYSKSWGEEEGTKCQGFKDSASQKWP